MNRELSGIVACLQEIEIAIKSLEDRGDAVDPSLLPALREKIRGFWNAPSIENARSVHRFIMENKDRPGNLPAGIPLFQTRVIVDHLNTSLDLLAGELLEVIEDAEAGEDKEER